MLATATATTTTTIVLIAPGTAASADAESGEALAHGAAHGARGGGLGLGQGVGAVDDGVELVAARGAEHAGHEAAQQQAEGGQAGADDAHVEFERRPEAALDYVLCFFFFLKPGCKLCC